MPVLLVALKKFPYCGQSYTPGDRFEARDESDARVLKVTKLAADAPVVSEPVQPVQVETPETIPRAKRGVYRRKDVIAEGE